MPKKTRKTAKASKGANAKGVAMVDSLSKIPALEKILKSGNLTIVLVYADWCGACQRFKKDVWGPSCKKGANHNRIAVRDDMVSKTSLNNAKFNYLPSLLVVDENGDMQEFKTPEGQATNAMPTPRSVDEMTRVMNVSLKPVAERTPTPWPSGENKMEVPISPAASANANAPIMKISNTEIEKAENTASPTLGTPAGKTYTPSPMTVPQRGGSLLATLLEVSRGTLPVLALGSLALLRRRMTKRKRRV